MKKIVSVFLSMILVFSLSSCGENKKEENKQEIMKIDQLSPVKAGDKVAEVETTLGTFKIKFLPEAAKKAVENFSALSEKKYYNGVIFHRVIKNFMVQTGDPTGTGRGGESTWGKDFEDEFNSDARHYRGAVSMANAGPNTNSSQFFIVTADNEDMARKIDSLKAQGYKFSDEQVEKYKNLGGTPHLDNRHSVFGHVYEGMDVVDKIQSVKTDSSDKPMEDVKIVNVTIKTIE